MYKLTLDKSSKKFFCPSCDKKRFVKYIDVETGQYCDDHFGRCDRVENCGYHQKPNFNQLLNQPKVIAEQIKPMGKIDPKYFFRCEDHTQSNQLFQWLCSLEGLTPRLVENSFKRYGVGTMPSGWLKGSSVFWQIDQAGRIRTGKVIQYKADGHKTGRFNWIHAILKKYNHLKQDWELRQCLFGLHLYEDGKPVAIVESEKSAIIASIYLPQFIWMACGGLSNIQPSKFIQLKSSIITLYPDISNNGKAQKQWESKAKELRSHGFRVNIAETFNTPEYWSRSTTHSDIADYLVETPLQEFTKYPPDWDEVVPKNYFKIEQFGWMTKQTKENQTAPT